MKRHDDLIEIGNENALIDVGKSKINSQRVVLQNNTELFYRVADSIYTSVRFYLNEESGRRIILASNYHIGSLDYYVSLFDIICDRSSIVFYEGVNTTDRRFLDLKYGFPYWLVWSMMDKVKKIRDDNDLISISQFSSYGVCPPLWINSDIELVDLLIGMESLFLEKGNDVMENHGNVYKAYLEGRRDLGYLELNRINIDFFFPIIVGYRNDEGIFSTLPFNDGKIMKLEENHELDTCFTYLYGAFHMPDVDSKLVDMGYVNEPEKTIWLDTGTKFEWLYR